MWGSALRTKKDAPEIARRGGTGAGRCNARPRLSPSADRVDSPDDLLHRRQCGAVRPRNDAAQGPGADAGSTSDLGSLGHAQHVG